MAYTVARAFDMGIFDHCRLLTGDAGIDNRILWVNILEILDDLSHLEAGELLITTAHGLSNQSALEQQEIVETFASHKLAAVVIQTGHYMKEIPVALVSLFRHYQIPLIEMPPDISFKQLTRNLVRALLHNEIVAGNIEQGSTVGRQKAGRADAIIAIWHRLVKENKPEMIQQELLDLGILMNQAFWVCMITICRAEQTNNNLSGGSEADLLKQLNQALIQVMRQRNIPFLAGPFENNLALLIQPIQSHVKTVNIVPIMTRRILEELRLLYPHLRITMGLSKEQYSLLELNRAILQAYRAMQVSTLQLLNNHGFTTYASMGLNRLILEINNIEVLKAIHEEAIAPLISYDCKTGGALLETLRVFLKHMSIRGGAEKLFIHRHTMKYRLNQIREITGINPENAAGFIQLAEGLTIHNYLNAKGLLAKQPGK